MAMVVIMAMIVKRAQNLNSSIIERREKSNADKLFKLANNSMKEQMKMRFPLSF